MLPSLNKGFTYLLTYYNRVSFKVDYFAKNRYCVTIYKIAISISKVWAVITGTIKEIISQNMNKLYWKNSDNLYNIYILKILGLTDTLDRFRLGSLLSL